jgi:hypothetical protein
MSAQAIGIDLGKTTFHLVALDRGARDGTNPRENRGVTENGERKSRLAVPE